ncbi:hypothetical protein [Castellaniella sp.]|uniref:hypothetical protein n=1 Tax=Castellaniella sp. TaxID=1955812 RepID=UPI002AFE3E25|nr:hypothetical protein [Castellaniella sp.]
MTNITQDPIRALIAKHHELLDRNPNLILRINYSPNAEWSAVMMDGSKNWAVISFEAAGRGATPDEACSSALKDLERRAAKVTA